MITWTPALQAAAIALANDPTPPHKAWRAQSDDDVRARALEYTRLRVGQVFEPFQVEYTQCLLQRLDLDWDDPRPTHVAFKQAWEDAQP